MRWAVRAASVPTSASAANPKPPHSFSTSAYPVLVVLQKTRISAPQDCLILNNRLSRRANPTYPGSTRVNGLNFSESMPLRTGLKFFLQVATTALCGRRRINTFRTHFLHEATMAGVDVAFVALCLHEATTALCRCRSCGNPAASK